MELIVDIKNQIGVYTITNLINRKVYIGSTTVCLYRRMSQHINSLRHNKHYNQHLQRSYNLYGDENFYFETLEIVDVKEKVKEREQYWIDIFWGDNCYNIRKDVIYGTGYQRSKETCDLLSEIHTQKSSKLYQGIEILDPEGNLHVFKGSIKRFAKKHNIHPYAFRKMLRGEYRQCKGWTLRDHDLPTLVSPEGKVYERVYFLLPFGKKYGLKSTGLSYLVNGQRSTYKGWTCANPKVK